MTQAILLAAGRGSRLGYLTDSRPKCLVLLGGLPLLEWQTSALKRNGISSISIVGGYRAHDLNRNGFKLVVNPDWQNTNMVETLFCAKDMFNVEDILISYTDIVYHPEIVQSLMQNESDISIVYDVNWKELWQIRFPNPLDDAETLKVRENYLVEIGRKTTSLSEIEGQYLGLLKIRPKGWILIEQILSSLPSEQRKEMDMTTLLQILIESNVKIEAIPIFGRWCEVDSLSDLAIYEKKLKDKNWKHDWRDGKTVRSKACYKDI